MFRAEQVLQATIRDIANEGPRQTTVTVTGDSICIKPEGTGTYDGDYAPIRLEYVDGKAVLYVWDDISSQEPRRIDLSAAMNTHRFTVEFLRYVPDDQEIAEKNFPDRPLQGQLTAQLAYELDENRALAGTYIVTSATIEGDTVERFGVEFTYKHPGGREIALQAFRAELQSTYDRFGMGGGFNIQS